MNVGQFHSLVPLDDPTQQGKRNRQSLGVPTSLYKVTAQSDGEAYTLRRLGGPPVPDGVIQQFGRLWLSINHPNICRLVELFNAADVRHAHLNSPSRTSAVGRVRCGSLLIRFMSHAPQEGQPCTYIVQQFFPNALTLEQAYLLQRQPLSEEVLWSITLQIIAAVHCVHNAGLAVRILDLSHVLITGKESVRLSACGLFDVVRPDVTRPTAQQQHEDLLALGRKFSSDSIRAHCTYASTKSLASKACFESAVHSRIGSPSSCFTHSRHRRVARLSRVHLIRRRYSADAPKVHGLHSGHFLARMGALVDGARLGRFANDPRRRRAYIGAHDDPAGPDPVVLRRATERADQGVRERPTSPASNQALPR